MHCSGDGTVRLVLIVCQPAQFGSLQPQTVNRTGCSVSPSRFCLEFVRSLLFMASTIAPRPRNGFDIFGGDARKRLEYDA